MGIFEEFKNNYKNYPDLPLFEDERNVYKVKDLYEISCKTYGFLKKNGIKKEQIIIVDLPRSGIIPGVVLGIIRSGAAFSILCSEKNEEIVSKTYEDCKPTLTINEEVLKTINTYEIVDSYEPVDPHDLCAVIYSSGSGGMMKGIMLEYGLLDTYLNELKEIYKNLDNPKKNTYTNLFLAGFYSISGFRHIIASTYLNEKTIVYPYNKLKDYEYLRDTINKNKISFLGCTTDYYKTARLDLCNSLEYLYVGYETSHDLVSTDKLTIENVYSMTEMGVKIASDIVKESSFISPVGYPNKNIGLKIIDLEGKNASKNEIGEICFEAPYFRGYINKPELTKSVKDGTLFHSTDLGYINDDNKLVVLGRIKDSIIVGNKYIVPTIINEKISKAINVQWSYVKINKENGNEIVLYYINDLELDYTKTMNNISKVLNKDELPKRIVKISKKPTLNSGKIDARELK